MAKYRLQTLLDMRERAEEEAKEAFARATARLREELDAKTKLEEELARMIEDRLRRREEYARKLSAGEMKVTDQAAAHRFIDRLKEDEADQKGKIDSQKERVREAEKNVERKQAALVEATQDLKALEKHREKWIKAVKRELALKDEDRLDEIAQTIHRTKSRESRD